MTKDAEFTAYALDQLSGLGAFDTKRMFGGTALLRNGVAFAKVKHGAFWLKAGNGNKDDFVRRGMLQYTYGKDNARMLNFFMTPPDVLEDRESLLRWANAAISAAEGSST